MIKIPSGEINNYLMLNKINLNKEQIILSTGMANELEILKTINFISKRQVYKKVRNEIKN